MMVPYRQKYHQKPICSEGVHYHSCENNIELMEEVFEKVRGGEDLVNKYLYYGWYGAKYWKKVDNAYGLGKSGRNLIKRHFINIDSIIRESSSISTYDIVSLGTGTGNDDVDILAKISGLGSRPSFNIIAIDLSWSLLLEGGEAIYHYIQKGSLKNFVSVHAICCDIENLSKADILIQGSKLGECRRNNAALFHLLGLTLSNNNEHNMLIPISKCMDDGDFLLIEVDLSADDNKSLASCRASYESGQIREIINKFICGPLLIATFFDSKIESDTMELVAKYMKNGREFDFARKSINIHHEQAENNVMGLSKVSNSINLVRYQSINGTNRLCDFSTKYRETGLKEFIDDLITENIPLELVGNLTEYGISDIEKRENNPLQYLVLLRFNKSICNPVIKAERVNKIYSKLIKLGDKFDKREYQFVEKIKSKEEEIKAKIARGIIKDIDIPIDIDWTLGDSIIDNANKIKKILGE